MKLIEAHATNYRNIIDADPVAIGQTTCLVGKNEAGKSAFLKALEGIRSTDASFKEYGKITNYPRRMLAEYEADHGEHEARVMRTRWKLDAVDKKLVAMEFGNDTLTSDTVIVEKTYEQEGTSWTVQFSEKAALDHLISHHQLTSDDRAALNNATTANRAAALLEALSARSRRF